MARTFIASNTVRQGLVAVLLGGMATFALALPLANTTQAQETTAPASTMEAEIMAAAPELFGFLKGNFPEEFAGFVTTVETTVANGGSLDGLVQAHLFELRGKYAAHLAGATDDALGALLTASIDLQKSVLDGEGPAACGTFAINGPAAFEGTPAAAKYEDLMMAQTVLLLAAAKGGHDAPVERAPAAEADWKVITDMMVEAGVSQGGFQAISTLDAANPELCASMLTMLEAMNTEPTGAGARVRAQYLVQLGAI